MQNEKSEYTVQDMAKEAEAIAEFNERAEKIRSARDKEVQEKLAKLQEEFEMLLNNTEKTLEDKQKMVDKCVEMIYIDPENKQGGCDAGIQNMKAAKEKAHDTQDKETQELLIKSIDNVIKLALSELIITQLGALRSGIESDMLILIKIAGPLMDVDTKKPIIPDHTPSDDQRKNTKDQIMQ